MNDAGEMRYQNRHTQEWTQDVPEHPAGGADARGAEAGSFDAVAPPPTNPWLVSASGLQVSSMLNPTFGIAMKTMQQVSDVEDSSIARQRLAFVPTGTFSRELVTVDPAAAGDESEGAPAAKGRVVHEI